MQTIIKANNLVVDFPIYNTTHRSLKNSIIRAASGGRIASNMGGHLQIRAIDNINFEFREGDRVGIQGHNGAGKSTLLRVLAGCYEPTSGTIISHGRIASLLDISIGFEPESTGYENIFLKGLLMGLSPKQIRNKIEEIVDFSGLGNFIEMPLRTYSSGMSMRLAFSISTNIEAEIILMDEWLSVGDSEFVEKAEKRLNALIKRTPILVIASHSKDLIKNICTRQFILHQGNMEEVV